MVIVTGTKRSGTSMWMQILDAAGIDSLGSAFPKNWGDTIRDANPNGFYETPLRRGIFYATNPHPVSGAYLDPRKVEDVGIKVFIPGLCRTDRAFITKVVATVRHWREYATSLERLRRMEEKASAKYDDQATRDIARLDPVLEWWLENFALVRNLVTRRYPAHLVTYDQVLDRPEEVLPPLLDWLGADDIEAGLEAVSPDARTQDRESVNLSHPFEETFDEFYELVHSGDPMTGEFVEKLNQTHRELIPEIEEDRRRVIESRMKRKTGGEAGEKPDPQVNPDALHPDALENLIHPEAQESRE